jgi:hypothetical protein
MSVIIAVDPRQIETGSSHRSRAAGRQHDARDYQLGTASELPPLLGVQCDQSTTELRSAHTKENRVDKQRQLSTQESRVSRRTRSIRTLVCRWFRRSYQDQVRFAHLLICLGLTCRTRWFLRTDAGFLRSLMFDEVLSVDALSFRRTTADCAG